MLVSQNKFDKSKSKYQCDRCKIYMDRLDRYSIYIAEKYTSPHKKWDLCNRCYNALVRGIEKGK